MTPVLVLAVGLLTAVGIYLLLARRVFSVILGVSLLTHAANLVVLATGGWSAKAPIVVDGVERAALADPVPQALVLTAIVISMAVTLYLLATFSAGARVLGRDEIRPAAAGDADRDPDSVRRELTSDGGRES